MTHASDRPRWLELGVVIVAAGSGARFGDAGKAFAPLAGRPVLEHSLRTLAAEREVSALVVVLGKHTLAAGAELVASLGLRDATVCLGGDTRRESVLAGLRALDVGIELVAVHDAARPLLSGTLLRRVVSAARAVGAAIPVQPLSDTIHAIDAGGFARAAPERACLRAAQTPQVARRDWLEEALLTVSDATDEGSALRSVGRPVLSVAGDPRNIKITWPDDLRVAAALLDAPPSDEG